MGIDILSLFKPRKKVGLENENPVLNLQGQAGSENLPNSTAGAGIMNLFGLKRNQAEQGAGTGIVVPPGTLSAAGMGGPDDEEVTYKDAELLYNDKAVQKALNLLKINKKGKTQDQQLEELNRMLSEGVHQSLDDHFMSWTQTNRPFVNDPAGRRGGWDLMEIKKMIDPNRVAIKKKKN